MKKRLFVSITSKHGFYNAASVCDADFFEGGEYAGSLNHVITLEDAERYASEGYEIEIKKR